ncbi:MAG: GNAT family N-acetyltransferase [Gemmataceae bacterium]
MSSDPITIAHRSLCLTESAFLKHFKQGRFQLREGIAFTGNELPGPGFNFAACLEPSLPPLSRIVEMGREFFGPVDSSWGILVQGGAGHPLEKEMQNSGWTIAEDEPAYVFTPLPTSTNRDAPSLPIRPVRTEADRRSFQRICTIAYQAPAELADLIMPSLAFATDPHMGWFLVEKQGEPVACGGYYRSEQTAVICCLATLPEARGQGLGKQLIQHCLDHAIERGCRHASLRSGPLSIPLYERAGFRYVCQHRTYTMPSRSNV